LPGGANAVAAPDSRVFLLRRAKTPVHDPAQPRMRMNPTESGCWFQALLALPEMMGPRAVGGISCPLPRWETARQEDV